MASFLVALAQPDQFGYGVVVKLRQKCRKRVLTPWNRVLLFCSGFCVLGRQIVILAYVYVYIHDYRCGTCTLLTQPNPLYVLRILKMSEFTKHDQFYDAFRFIPTSCKGQNLISRARLLACIANCCKLHHQLVRFLHLCGFETADCCLFQCHCLI